MRQRQTSLIGCCRQRATASPICKHCSRWSIVLPFSKDIFNIFQIIFTCLFRWVRSYDKEVITRLFSYRHLYQDLGPQQPSTSSGADVDDQAWYRCRYENSRVITSKYHTHNTALHNNVAWWHNIRVVRASDFWLSGLEFNSQLDFDQVTTLGLDVHAHVPLSPKSIIWYRSTGCDVP